MSFSIKKISLSPTAKSVRTSGAKSTPPKRQQFAAFSHGLRGRWMKITGIVVGVIILLGIDAFFAIVVPARATYAIARETAQIGQEAVAAAKEQDLTVTSEKLNQLASKLEELEASYGKLSWTRMVPFIGGYYRDGEHGMTAAEEFVAAGKIALESVTPYADLLGFTEGDSAFVDQPADQRIETAVATFDKITPNIGKIAEHLRVAKEAIDQIEPGRYPSKVGDRAVRAPIAEAQTTASEAIAFFLNAQPLLEQLPSLMGEPEPKRYLVLFQNDKELRATGGFITAYALFQIDKGKLIVEKSEDIYVLDEQQVKRIAAPEEILKYHKGVFYANLRDSNISPDFYDSMQQFEALLKNVSNPPKYDGIVAVDTHVLVEAMRVLDGEVFVPEYNTNFSIQQDERCDGCPQVVYELEEFADRPVGHVREERKDILGRLLLNLMKKALGVSPGQYWGPLTQTFIKELNEKHILVYMKEPEGQAAFETLNFAGRIADYDGDYLHINDTNFAGAKSNMFVKHYIRQEIDVANDGTVTKTLTIDYKNPSPPSNCSLLAGGLCLNGLLRNWLRIYVPKGSKLVEFTGADQEGIESTTTEDLEKTVFEGFLTVRPEGSSQVIVKYELPFKMHDSYRLLIQKQPGTEGHEYTMVINGKEKEVFNLITDREVLYKL